MALNFKTLVIFLTSVLVSVNSVTVPASDSPKSLPDCDVNDSDSHINPDSYSISDIINHGTVIKPESHHNGSALHTNFNNCTTAKPRVIAPTSNSTTARIVANLTGVPNVTKTAEEAEKSDHSIEEDSRQGKTLNSAKPKNLTAQTPEHLSLSGAAPEHGSNLTLRNNSASAAHASNMTLGNIAASEAHAAEMTLRNNTDEVLIQKKNASETASVPMHLTEVDTPKNTTAVLHGPAARAGETTEEATQSTSEGNGASTKSIPSKLAIFAILFSAIKLF